MLVRSLVTKILGPGAFVLLIAATSTGCNGCNPDAVQCDEDGKNCQICDGYGCHPVERGSGGAGGEGGAGSACDGMVTTCPCATNDECLDGTQCIEGLCIDACDFSYECGDGKVCANGQCVAGCDATTPCAGGTTCDKGICVPDPTNPACSDAKPCSGEGELCVDGICTTACQGNADCAEGQICDASTGSCIVDPSPQPGCAATTCAALGQQCMKDGYCHYPCTDQSVCQRIDARFVACEAGICRTREEIAPECTSDQPCPYGQDCISNKCL